MTNITISIPEETYKKMKKYPEIKWSEVLRKAIMEYLEKLRTTEEVEATELLNTIRETGIDIESIPLNKAEKHYEKTRELEWKRTSTTQTF